MPGHAMIPALEGMPKDILLCICEYLPPEEMAILTLVCHSIRNNIGKNLYENYRPGAPGRLRFLELLERDPRHRMVVCRFCDHLHSPRVTTWALPPVLNPFNGRDGDALEAGLFSYALMSRDSPIRLQMQELACRGPSQIPNVAVVVHRCQVTPDSRFELIVRLVQKYLREGRGRPEDERTRLAEGLMTFLNGGFRMQGLSLRMFQYLNSRTSINLHGVFVYRRREIQLLPATMTLCRGYAYRQCEHAGVTVEHCFAAPWVQPRSTYHFMNGAYYVRIGVWGCSAQAGGYHTYPCRGGLADVSREVHGCAQCHVDFTVQLGLIQPTSRAAVGDAEIIISSWHLLHANAGVNVDNLPVGQVYARSGLMAPCGV